MPDDDQDHVAYCACGTRSKVSPEAFRVGRRHWCSCGRVHERREEAPGFYRYVQVGTPEPMSQAVKEMRTRALEQRREDLEARRGR